MRSRILLAGGGLANSLIAYRLGQLRPDVDVHLVELRRRLGEGRTWSFHGGDLTPDQHEWMAPLVERAWGGHRVCFPGHSRAMTGSYHTVTPERVERALRENRRVRVTTGARVAAVEPRRALLDDGSVLEADAVVDGRGAELSSALRVAFQKFVGLHVELHDAADLDGPVLMDATVAQREGFRFMYCLPFGRRSLLVEDTRYSNGRDLDRDEMEQAILRYADRRGWRVRAILSREEGVLPILLDGDIDAYWAAALPGVPRSGMRAALFHPTTGYSLPEAVRLADDLAGQHDLSPEALDRLVRERSVTLWRRGGFFRLLNRMLFDAAEPDERRRVLERFYRLPEPLVRRFYAGRPSLVDRLRILTGRPPVPLRRALACLRPRPLLNPTALTERK